MGSFFLVRTTTVSILKFLVPHSRSEKAGAALPLVPERNEKSYAAAPVKADEESDAELDRYGARNREEMGNKWQMWGKRICQYLHFLAIVVISDLVQLSGLQQSRALHTKLHSQ